MANLKVVYGRELDKQAKIEGPSKDIDLLRKVLEVCKTGSDWSAMTKAKFHKYGTRSYESYRFWYPSDLLVKLKDVFEN